MLILKPSKKKILVICLLFLTLASICFFIEPISNKITQGTHIIGVYESILFYLLFVYYLLQLVPGYAKLTMDDSGFSETWFFRQRITIPWSSADIKKCKQLKAGDTLYVNSVNEQLFSRKIACKGTYKISDKYLYQKIIELLKTNSSIVNSNKRYYFILGRMRKALLIIFAVIIVAFNSYYLSNEKTEPAFIEQVKHWQQQGNTDKQLFELFKIYGFYWKNQLKQFDRNLFHRILLQESQQIEELIIKRKQPLLDIKKAQIEQQLISCREKYLYYDESLYYQCLEKI
jgi:hypothetical protein